MTQAKTPESTAPLEDQWVSQLVATDPRRAVVFERLGIDYCCGGKIPLAQAAEENGLDIDKLREELSEATKTASDERDWTAASIDELVDNIMSSHHEYVRSELPRITMLATKVAKAHGAKYGEVVEAEKVVLKLAEDLLKHTDNEEDEVFPRCRKAAHGELSGTAPADLAQDLERLVAEHDEAGDDFVRLHELLNDLVAPEYACTSWRAYLDALSRLEQDLHRHIHKENHIMFPKVLDLVSSPAGAPQG